MKSLFALALLVPIIIVASGCATTTSGNGNGSPAGDNASTGSSVVTAPSACPVLLLSSPSPSYGLNESIQLELEAVFENGTSASRYPFKLDVYDVLSDGTVKYNQSMLFNTNEAGSFLDSMVVKSGGWYQSAHAIPVVIGTNSYTAYGANQNCSGQRSSVTISVGGQGGP